MRPQNWRPITPTLIVFVALLSMLLNTGALAQWSPPMRISNDLACFNPQIMYSGEVLHLIYGSGLNRAFYQRSTDNGQTWTDPFRIDQGAGGTSAKPAMAARGDTVVAAWYHTLQVGHNIGFRQSTNGGAGWNAVSFVLASDYLNLQKLSLTISDRNVFLVFTYADDSIRFCLTRSTDLGASWSIPNEMFRVQSSEGMNLLNRGDTLLLLWSAVYSWQDLMELYFCRSTDGGTSWSDIALLSTDDDHGSQNPSLSLNDQGRLAAFWTDGKYSPYAWTGDVFVRCSDDLGVSWTDEVALTDDHLAIFPCALWEGDSIHLTWEDYSQDPGNISYMYSSNNGLTWEQREAVDDTSADSMNPGLALTPGRVHIVWDERRSSEQGVFYSYRLEEPDGVEMEGSGFWPEQISLQSYPNPFNSNTIIAYSSLKGGEIAIFDIKGQLVRTFFTGGENEGRIRWDATDAMGNKVSSGIYFARASASQDSQTIKLLYLK